MKNYRTLRIAAIALAVGLVGLTPATAQDTKVIHLMSDEISPESQAFYRGAAEAYEAANPGVSLELDFQGNMDQALAVRVAG